MRHRRVRSKAPFSRTTLFIVAANLGPPCSLSYQLPPGSTAAALAHRRGIAIPGHFMPANRAASSKSARLLCLRQRFADFLETSSLVPPPAALRLLYTVAALAIPASDKAEITAAASKAGRFLCLRQRFPSFHITRWKTLCIMWKTSCYVILWKSCENFAHPLCTAKVLSFRPKTDFSTKEALYDPYH